MSDHYTYTNSKGVTYHLHMKEVTLRGGRKQTIYYFARTVGEKGTPCQLPEGKQVVENPRNGFLVIKNV